MSLPLAGATVKAADLAGIFPTGVDSWDDWAPAWSSSGTQPSIGNGTLTGLHMTVGAGEFFTIALTIGSTTTLGTGNYFFSYPGTPAISPSGVVPPLGWASLYDASAGNRYMRTACGWTTNVFGLFDDSATLVAATVPFTWASGDKLAIAGFLPTA